AVPALACWLVGTLAVGQKPRSVLLDTGGLLAGGLLAGGLGLAWLAATGTWQPFWDIFLGWNGGYFTIVRDGVPPSALLLYWVVRYLPWSLVHALAIPVALASVGRAVASRGRGVGNPVPRALLGAFYLGWLVQAASLQNPHDYVLIPTVFPAVVLVAG